MVNFIKKNTVLHINPFFPNAPFGKGASGTDGLTLHAQENFISIILIYGQQWLYEKVFNIKKLYQKFHYPCKAELILLAKTQALGLSQNHLEQTIACQFPT